MGIHYLNTTLASGIELCPDRAISEQSIRTVEGDDWDSSDPTDFGSIVHETVEEVHNLDMKGEVGYDVWEIFKDLWAERNITDLSYFGLGRDMVVDFIDRTLYDRDGVTIATEWSFVIDVLSLSITPVDGMDKEEIVNICDRISAMGGVPFLSTIDRIDRTDDDVFVVTDYKTNTRPFTRDEIENSKQLAVYALAVKTFWPEATKVVCTYDMLRHGRFSHVFTEDKLEELRDWLEVTWEQIQRIQDDPPARLNPFCGWCSKRRDCETYADAVEGRLTEAYTGPNENQTIADLFETYEALKMVEKHAKYRSKEFKDVLVAAIVKNDNQPIAIDDEQEIYLQANPRYDYPPEDVLAVLQRHRAVGLLTDAISISRPKLEKVVRTREKIRSAIEPLLKKYFVSPTLASRKRKEDEASE